MKRSLLYTDPDQTLTVPNPTGSGSKKDSRSDCNIWKPLSCLLDDEIEKLCILLKTELGPHCSGQVCIYNPKSSSVMRGIFQYLIVIFEAPSDKIIIWPISCCPTDCGRREFLIELWHFTQLNCLIGPDRGQWMSWIFLTRERSWYLRWYLVSCVH